MSPVHRLVPLLLSTALCAQAAGMRGASQEPPQVPRLRAPDPTTAERLITIEAVAEVRVAPSALRVVFSLSARGENGSAAHAAGRALVADTRRLLQAAGVAQADVDVDFIAAMPVYAWQIDQQGGRDILAEHRVGTRVQYNLHVTVADEPAALAIIEAATAADGVDVLAVDYWEGHLAEHQDEARRQALAAAKQKADLLLAVFAEPPTPVNIHEETRVVFPHQLYSTLPAAEDSASSWYSRDELPRVPASRPLHVYYRGLFADVDVVPSEMPGRRDIEVVSTVRLYYAAPERPPQAR